MTVFIVKSFGPQLGYQNLKAFDNLIEAENYQALIQKQIPKDIENEFVDIETMTIEG
jgi:GTP-sensing pleiotropic transcriptional regulator CodY